jgi:hypothetical protein
MKVIKPTTITPSLIISSSLQETEQPWSSIINYSTGARVYVGLDGIYEAITANTNKNPTENPLDWLFIKPSNRWALFDSQISTLSSGQNSINFTLSTGAIQSFALLNITGNTVDVIVRDVGTGDIIYEGFQSLIGEVFDWYQYFFFDLETQRNQAIFTDLPLNYINTTTEVTISGTNTVSVGTFTFGKLLYIGKSEYGVSSGITDYSVKQTDEFGQTTFVRRAFSKRMGGRVLVNNGELNRIQRALYELRAVPALWFASENPSFEEALVVFGYYRDFSTDISYPNYSYCSLEIEGLI